MMSDSLYSSSHLLPDPSFNDSFNDIFEPNYNDDLLRFSSDYYTCSDLPLYAITVSDWKDDSRDHDDISPATSSCPSPSFETNEVYSDTDASIVSSVSSELSTPKPWSSMTRREQESIASTITVLLSNSEIPNKTKCFVANIIDPTIDWGEDPHIDFSNLNNEKLFKIQEFLTGLSKSNKNTKSSKSSTRKPVPISPNSRSKSKVSKQGKPRGRPRKLKEDPNKFFKNTQIVNLRLDDSNNEIDILG